MDHTGPIATMAAGAALGVASVITRLRRNRTTRRPVPACAVARLAWDLIVGAATLFLFGTIAFAPRNQMPRPVYKPRRVATPITPAKARQVASGRGKR